MVVIISVRLWAGRNTLSLFLEEVCWHARQGQDDPYYCYYYYLMRAATCTCHTYCCCPLGQLRALMKGPELELFR